MFSVHHNKIHAAKKCCIRSFVKESMLVNTHKYIQKGQRQKCCQSSQNTSNFVYFILRSMHSSKFRLVYLKLRDRITKPWHSRIKLQSTSLSHCDDVW
jgi:hypothetical protein